MSEKNQKRVFNPKAGTTRRLLKMLWGYYPKMMPLILCLIVLTAVISAVPAVFQQKVVAVIQETWETQMTWEQAKPHIMHYVLILAGFYVISQNLKSVNNCPYRVRFISASRTIFRVIFPYQYSLLLPRRIRFSPEDLALRFIPSIRTLIIRNQEISLLIHVSCFWSFSLFSF